MPISADKDYSLGRRHRGRLQNDHWTTTQALRNALDRPRRQRYHRAALLPDEWPLGGILGDALGQDQLTPTNLSHTSVQHSALHLPPIPSLFPRPASQSRHACPK